MQINPEVDVLSVNSAHQIGVRLKSVKEKYHKFVDELKTWFSENGCQELRGFETNIPCIWKSPTSWYRSIIVSQRDQYTVRIRLVDAAKDKDVRKRSLFVLPPQFLSHRAFSFNIHLAQIPETTVIPIDSIWKYLKKYRNSLTLVSRGKPVIKFGSPSLPGEICWLETEDGEDPFAPSAEKQVTLSQCLFKDGLVSFKEDQDDFEAGSINNNSIDREIIDIEYLEKSLDHDHDSKDDLGDGRTDMNCVRAECSAYDQKTYSDPPSFRWKDPILPAAREFLARGTHVDNAGQIYMHLYEERHKFTELRRTLNKYYEFSQPDCDAKSFTLGQDVVARWQESPEFPEEWYRARFISYQPGSQGTECCVYFVDWGNISQMKTSQLRKELIETDTPIFAFKTILSDVLSFDHKDWTHDSLSFIHEKINFENKNIQGGRNIIRVRTMSQTGKLPLLVDIQLNTPYEEDVGQKRNVFISVSDLLLERGDAVKATITEVNSKGQRNLRKKHDYGVRHDKKAFKENKHDNQSKYKKNLDSQNPSDVFEKVKPSVCSPMLSSGSKVVVCQVQAFLAWNQLSVHLLPKKDTQTEYEALRRNLNREVRGSSVIHLPRKGMTVAMHHEDLGWVRAEILDCDQETEDIYVRLVDFGTEEWVRLRPDTILLRYLPLHLKQVPCQAVTLQLPIVSVLDEDEDTLLSLMAETVLSSADTHPHLRIRVRHISNQTVLGHIVDSNNKIIYRSLEKENIIKIT